MFHKGLSSRLRTTTTRLPLHLWTFMIWTIFYHVTGVNFMCITCSTIPVICIAVRPLYRRRNKAYLPAAVCTCRKLLGSCSGTDQRLRYAGYPECYRCWHTGYRDTPTDHGHICCRVEVTVSKIRATQALNRFTLQLIIWRPICSDRTKAIFLTTCEAQCSGILVISRLQIPTRSSLLWYISIFHDCRPHQEALWCGISVYFMTVDPSKKLPAVVYKYILRLQIPAWRLRQWYISCRLHVPFEQHWGQVMRHMLPILGYRLSSRLTQEHNPNVLFYY